jgi:hypothetical protein
MTVTVVATNRNGKKTVTKRVGPGYWPLDTNCNEQSGYSHCYYLHHQGVFIHDHS